VPRGIASHSPALGAGFFVVCRKADNLQGRETLESSLTLRRVPRLRDLLRVKELKFFDN